MPSMIKPPQLKWLVLGITSAFFLFEFVARIEPGLAAAAITQHFNLSNAGFGLLSSLFFWIYAPMQLLVGLLLDRYGARRFLVPAILLCATGVAVFAWTSDPVVAGIGRFMTGLGASFAFVSSLYVVNHWFPPRQFAVLSGLVNAIGMLGTAVGAIALTSVIKSTGWQPVFFATSVAGVILFLLAFFFLKDSVEQKQGQSKGASESFIDPLMAVIRDSRIWLIAVIGALYYMPVNVFGGLWGHEELMHDHQLGSLQAEIVVSMIFLGMTVGSIGAGALSDWLSHRKWLVISNSFLAAVAYGIVIFYDTQSVWLLSVLLFLGGLLGGAQMLTFAMAKEGHKKAASGTIIAFVNMVGIGGALVFQPLVGVLIDKTGGDYTLALATMPACLFAASVLSLLVHERRHPEHF